MNWKIKINGKLYSNSNYKQIAIDEIVGFLDEWNNVSEYIIVKTSGSTGTPKSINLLKSDMVASARLTMEYFELSPNQTGLLCLPVKYIAGKMMIVRAIVAGFNLITITPSSNPIKELTQKIDFAAMTPMQVESVLKQNPDKLTHINTLIIGGAAVSKKLEEKLQILNTACYSTYGMTETITHIAVKKLNGIDKSDYFKTLPNVTVSADSRGCCLISSPHLNNSSITTNDKVLIVDNQTFSFIGRVDNVINSGGIKLQPEEIESKLSSSLFDRRFFISSEPDNKFGQIVILIIEGEKCIDNIEVIFKEELNTFEIPKKVYYTKQFIEAGSGKINRFATFLACKQ